MKSMGIFPAMIAIILAGSLMLTGCNQADRQMGAANENQQTGTAMVRGSDSDINRMSMPEQMKQCQGMMKEHLGNADEQFDLRFIDMMIPHHQGAVQMAKDAQQKAQHPEIKKMAQNIIDSQQKEIKQLQAWRKQWYGSEQTAAN